MFETKEMDSQGRAKLIVVLLTSACPPWEGIPGKPLEAAASELPLRRKRSTPIYRNPANSPGTPRLLIHRFRWTHRYFWATNA